VRIVCCGKRARRLMRPLAHRRVRRYVRVRLHGCQDFEALVLEPRGLTGRDIA